MGIASSATYELIYKIFTFGEGRQFLYSTEMLFSRGNQWHSMGNVKAELFLVLKGINSYVLCVLLNFVLVWQAIVTAAFDSIHGHEPS